MRLITSILVSSILLISVAGRSQNPGIAGSKSDSISLDNSQMLIGERGSGRDEQKQTPIVEQQVNT